MERSIREYVRIAGKAGYAQRIDAMSEYVQKVVENPLIVGDVRTVLGDVLDVLRVLSEDVKQGRVQ